MAPPACGRPLRELVQDAHSRRAAARELGPLVALVRLALRPGPKFTAGTPSAAKRATSVHACFGSTRGDAASRSAAHERVARRAAAPTGDRSVELDLGAAAHRARAASALRLARACVSGAKRWFRFSSNASGTMLRPRPPSPASRASPCGRRSRRADLARRAARASSAAGSGPALWIAFSPCHGRALCAVRPSKRHRRVDRARCSRGCSLLSLGSRQTARSTPRRARRRSSTGRARSRGRALLARVEDQREVARGRLARSALDELEHQREARLHVGRAGAVERVALDARRGRRARCARCRGGRRARRCGAAGAARRRGTTKRVAVAADRRRRAEQRASRASTAIAERLLFADGRRDARRARAASRRGACGRWRRALTTGTPKSRSAALSETLRSVLALRLPMISAHGTPNSPAGNFFARMPGITTLRAGTRPRCSTGSLPGDVEDRRRRREHDAGADAPPRARRARPRRRRSASRRTRRPR